MKIMVTGATGFIGIHNKRVRQENSQFFHSLRMYEILCRKISRRVCPKWIGCGHCKSHQSIRARIVHGRELIDEDGSTLFTRKMALNPGRWFEHWQLCLCEQSGSCWIISEREAINRRGTLSSDFTLWQEQNDGGTGGASL